MNIEDTIYSSRATCIKPLAGLRFSDGVLQQQVGHEKYEDGLLVERVVEWEDVPKVYSNSSKIYALSHPNEQ